MSFTLTKNAPSGEIPNIQRDTYVLRLVQIGDPVDVPAFDNPEQMRTRFRLDWEIADYAGDDDDAPDNVGTRVSEWFTASLHERSKLLPFVKAMLGRDIETGENLEMQSLVGSLIKCDVWSKDNGYLAVDAPKPFKKRKARVAAEDADDVPF